MSLPVNNNSDGFVMGSFVEFNHEIPDHCGEIVDYFLPMSLDSNSSAVSWGVSIHWCHHRRNWWFPLIWRNWIDIYKLLDDVPPPAGGWVTSAPMKMTGSVNIFGRIVGTKILFIPPSFTFIFRQRFDNVWGDVLFTFLTWTHWVAIPKSYI